MSDEPLPTVTRTPLRWWTITAVSMVLLIALLALSRATHPVDSPERLVFTVFAVYVVVQLAVGLTDRPRTGRSHRQAPDMLDVVAIVPAFNEDPEALRRCLRGFLEQTRCPDGVVVVDDGSDASDYGDVRHWFLAEGAERGVRCDWVRTENQGKRRAQIEAVRRERDADIYITVDSDSILDHHAVERALPAFDDPDVQSVAAVILSTNYRQTMLARVMDLYCVGLQLFERSAFSRLDAVMVNAGGCAFYRGAVIRDNVAVYLSETVFGRPVHFSDDSMLTLFALRRGKAVQQADCFAFTLMPATFDHHRRQQVRWMRGSFIRSGWRMRFLPLHRWAYWLHLVKWVMVALMTGTLVVLVVDGRLADPTTIGVGLVSALGLYALTVLRYLTVVRSDQSTWQRLLTFATVPLAAIWSLTFLRVLRWYAMATFTRVEWGTRTEVEVRSS